MYTTIGDKILEDVRKFENGELGSTSSCMMALELPNEYRYNTQGNYYSACLSIISQLQKQIEELTRSQS